MPPITGAVFAREMLRPNPALPVILGATGNRTPLKSELIGAF